MKLPAKPYANLPIYSLGASTLPKKEAGVTTQVERPSPNHRNSLRPSTSRLPSH